MATKLLEGVAVSVLSKYLGKYVVGLDADNLSLSIGAGDLMLEKLELRSDALGELDLPVTVKGGEARAAAQAWVLLSRLCLCACLTMYVCMRGAASADGRALPSRLPSPRFLLVRHALGLMGFASVARWRRLSGQG